MLVQELMNPNPITIGSRGTLRDALDTMLRHDIHELPVVMGGNLLVGIVTRRDVQVALEPGSPLMALSAFSSAVPEPIVQDVARDAMSSDVKTIAPTESMTNACRMLVSLRVGTLPVVDAVGRLHGVVSVWDVVAAAADLFEGR